MTPGADYRFDFNIKVLQKAIDSGTISFPRGLTHEQRRAYIKEQLERIDEKDQSDTR